MLDEMTKHEFIKAMLSDEKASWTVSEAGALFERMTETYQLETHTLADIKADWLSFDSGIKALEYFVSNAEHGNDEEYAGEWLHELTGTVYDIIWHDNGVLVSPCVWQ